MFTAGVQLGSEQNVLSSDGVTFKAYAWEKAAPPATRPVLSLEQFSGSATPTQMVLDLSSLKGKEITIRLETHPGATVDNDSAVWVKPRVELATDAGSARIATLNLVSPQPLTSVESTAGPVQTTDLGNHWYEIAAPATGTLYLIHSSAGTAQLPLPLREEPFDSSLLFENGTESPPQGPFGGITGTGVVLGVQKQGLDAHPPQRGQTHVDYVVKLPATGAASLSGFAGIKDGADDSQGVGFRIAVNGTELWTEDLMPGEAWTPFDVSLADFAGETVVLTLITDSLGDYGYDWAFWGEPMITAIQP